MLQFKTVSPDRYSVPEQCQMVIEGGCGWIQLHIDEMEDASTRELATELIPLCRETSTILMLENKPDLAKDLGLHGVHITLDSGLNARKIREEFGPEAIIGVEVGDASSVLFLKDADIDYCSLPENFTSAQRRRIVRDVREAGCMTPIVFAGNFAYEDIEALLSEGARGICTGKTIMEATNPVSYTERLLTKLMSRG